MTTLIRSLHLLPWRSSLSPALAGPPLICRQFQTDGGKLIAWGTGPARARRSRAISRRLRSSSHFFVPVPFIVNMPLLMSNVTVHLSLPCGVMVITASNGLP